MFLADAVSFLDHYIGGILDFLIGCLNQYIGQCVGHYSSKCQSSNGQSIITCIGGCSLTDSDSLIVYISGLAVNCFLQAIQDQQLTSIPLVVDRYLTDMLLSIWYQ